MSTINSTAFIRKITPSYLIIHTNLYEYYRLLIRHLIENNYRFHSYQQYDKRTLWTLILILHPSTSSEDIILKKLNFPTIKLDEIVSFLLHQNQRQFF